MFAVCTTIPTDLAAMRAVEALIDGSPDGLVAHVGGETPEGWRIIDVWETEQHWQRFSQDILSPAISSVVGERTGPRPVPLTVTGQLERRPATVGS